LIVGCILTAAAAQIQESDKIIKRTKNIIAQRANVLKHTQAAITASVQLINEFSQ
jgi:hypothetical protein